jgi:uncharacterized protein (TIGR01777 family)
LARRVVRTKPRADAHEIGWNPATGDIDSAKLATVDGVVHLAGAGVAAKRWTDSYKFEIRDSRVRGTTLLCETLARGEDKPAVLVSASAVGYYGDRGDELIDESSPPGKGFLAEVCKDWEAATAPARDAGIRVVNLRIGVVLDPKGGALSQMLTPFKLGAGGVLGSGGQHISWITLEDIVRAIQFCLASAALSGPVNGAAPEPVTNRELTKTLGRVLGRPTLIPMPAFAARMAFGEMADEMLLGGARVQPRVLTSAGFRFNYPMLEPALRHMLSTSSAAAQSP